MYVYNGEDDESRSVVDEDDGEDGANNSDAEAKHKGGARKKQQTHSAELQACANKARETRNIAEVKVTLLRDQRDLARRLVESLQRKNQRAWTQIDALKVDLKAARKLAAVRTEPPPAPARKNAAVCAECTNLKKKIRAH